MQTKIRDTLKTAEWFDRIVGSLRADQLMIEQEVAPQEKKKLYDDLRNGNFPEVASQMIDTARQLLIPQLLTDFLSELNTRHVKFNQLGFDLTETKILVWIEVQDDDSVSESNVFLSEAKTNSNYNDCLFKISSTVVEASDKIKVPDQYKLVTN